MVGIGTTSKFIFGTGARKASFILHADIDNTDDVKISGTDPNVVSDWEELAPGQSISFENYKGMVYGLAESGTQNVYIPFVNYDEMLVSKS